MNAVEIEEAISTLAGQMCDPAEFPFAFLQALGNEEATNKTLRAGASNRSDPGGVLQTNHIHILGFTIGTAGSSFQKGQVENSRLALLAEVGCP